MTETVQIESLDFNVRRSEQRKTVAITVERDGTLTINAPIDSTSAQLQTFAEEKLFWVYSKLAEKQLFNRSSRKRQFVNGESLYYLGRKYRLLIVDEESLGAPLRLHRGMFELRRDVLESAKDVFVDWYVGHAQTWLWNRANQFTDRLDMQLSALQVDDIGFRWGAYNGNGTIKFHWRVILLPPQIVDYVLVHELAHHHEPHHNQTYWHIVERVLPNYPSSQRWLALNGARYDV